MDVVPLYFSFVNGKVKASFSCGLFLQMEKQKHMHVL